jgi:hypothetical protein
MVDAPGEIKIKIYDISVILKDTANLRIVFYGFFNTKRTLRTVNFYLKTRFKIKMLLFLRKNGGCAGQD